jgi:hypothetical protein
MEVSSLMKIPEKRSYFIESCAALGLNPQMNSTFDWLEANDRESFRRKSLSHFLLSAQQHPIPNLTTLWQNH